MPNISLDIQITDDGLGIYLPKIETLVYADLHIGIEETIYNDGTYLPIDQFQIMIKYIKLMIEELKPKILLINGDFKHEFSQATRQEWCELQELFKIIKKHNLTLEIIRGNHDNYLKTIIKRFGIHLREPYFQISKYLFIHGHELIPDDFLKTAENIEWIILAHEHPAIILHDDTGGKHKFKCFLIGSWNKYNVLVLPALSPLATGAIMNFDDNKRILSPLLRIMDLPDFRPVVFDKGELLKFPCIKDMINVSSWNDFDKFL
jgi:putative SbcD/Mre11-related phosphoesterase